MKLKQFIPQKVSAKLAFVICLLVTVLISALGFMIIRVSQDMLLQNVKENHEQIAERTANEISLFVKRPQELLAIVGTLLGRIHADSLDQETVLVEMSLQYPMLEEILSISQQGEETASSNPGFAKKTWNQDQAFQEALKGKIYTSPVFIAENHFPYVILAMPYKQVGKIYGVLRAKVNLRGMWNIIDEIHIGQTGRAFLVSSNGWIVAHPDKKLVLRNENIHKHARLSQLIAEKPQSLEYFKNGKNYLVSYAKVDGRISLGVVIQRESNEAFYFLRRVKMLVLWVLSLSLAVSLFVSIVLARWLAQPVRALQRWSKKIARGDFDYYILPRSTDEIGQLFIMFKRMSERFRAARERERLAALGEVATSISHKLKNSIVSLKTFAQILPQRKDDEFFMRRFEEKFSATVKHLEKIFTNLSQMASLQNSQKESIALGALLEYLHDFYEETTQRQQIDFRLELSEHLPHLWGDRDQLKEMFSNLIQNAIQAMPEGGILTIKASYLIEPTFVRITLSDTGHGIDSKYVDSIFKPFFTTKNGGMGLGLSVSKKIIEDHHGSLTLVSHDQRGCLFQILFPLRSLDFPKFPNSPKILLQQVSH